MSFTNKMMVNDLKKWGVIPNKTHGLSIPIINQELMRFLLLGWFDGDGCIHESKKSKGNGNNTVFNIAGTKESMTDMVSIFKKYVNVDLSIVARPGKTYVVYCYKKKDIKTIYDLFYTNTTLGLKDKKCVFESIINRYNLEGSSETWFDLDIEEDIYNERFIQNTHELNSILIGLIMGCSNLIGSGRMRVNNGAKDQDYFNRKMRILDEHFSDIKKGVQDVSGKSYPYAYVKHKTKLKYLYEEFYYNKKKILKDSIIRRITPDVLAVLFCERGTVKTEIGELHIAMRSFSKHELTQLVNFIRNKYKVEFKVLVLSGSSVLITRQVDKFLELISPMYYRIQSIPLKLVTP